MQYYAGKRCECSDAYYRIINGLYLLFVQPKFLDGAQCYNKRFYGI